MQHYKKAGPSTPIWMPSGDALKFPTLDGATGYYQTDDPAQIAALEKCIKEGRGGVSASTAAEYDANYAKKKLNSPPFVQRSMREEIGAGPLQDTLQRRVEADAAFARRPEVAVPVKEEAAPVPQAPLKPRVGKRPKAE